MSDTPIEQGEQGWSDWQRSPYDEAFYRDRPADDGVGTITNYLSLDYLNALEADLDRLRTERDGLIRECNEVEQLLGQALGYPWYKDDPKNFPDATLADGVCVGEHVPGTIAAEAATKLIALRKENETLRTRAEQAEVVMQNWKRAAADAVKRQYLNMSDEQIVAMVERDALAAQAGEQG